MKRLNWHYHGRYALFIQRIRHGYEAWRLLSKWPTGVRKLLNHERAKCKPLSFLLTRLLLLLLDILSLMLRCTSLAILSVHSLATVVSPTFIVTAEWFIRTEMVRFFCVEYWMSPITTIEQEALQMQRDHATRHKYEISHLKRLAIGNDLPNSRSLQLLLLDRPYTSISSC